MAKRIFFARYQEEERLGQGGIGEVYRVTDLWENRVKALKFLLSEFRSSSFEQSFRQEFFLLKQFSHPNVVRVYDFHTLDKAGGPSYSMEFIEGVSLADFLKQQPDQFNRILFQICQILEFIHLQGIIHCDLKPDNFKVMVNPAVGAEVRVKLLDFGLAESLELLKENKIKGTLDYMAPEVLSGAPYDFKTDLYSLGVILYELVTGQLPFHSPDPAVLISKVLEEPPLAPRAVNQSISPELEGLVLKLLEKNPERRISSAGEVKDFFARSLETDATDRKEWLPLLESGNWVPSATIRDQMLSELRAPGSRGKLSLVCGAPGVGKSRALRELYYHSQKENRPVLLWELQEDFKESCEEFCHRLFLLGEYSPAEEMRGLQDLFRQIASVTDPTTLRRKMAEIIGRLPFTVLIDQLNFQAETDFIKYLSQENKKSSIFMAFKAFPGQTTSVNLLIHSHPETEEIELIQLTPLSLTEFHQFLSFKLPGFHFNQKFLQRAWHHSGGNPELASDYLKCLWQSGYLYYQSGKINLGKIKAKPDVETKALTEFYRYVISGLDPAQNSFLRIISVLGCKFDLEAVLFLSQTKIDECYEHLRYFLREGVLLPRQDSDKIEYEFSPPALQEQLYSEVTGPDKKSLHRQIADYFEGQKSQGAEVSFSILAHHYLRADIPEKAYYYSLLAAQEALRSLTKSEVLFHFKNAFYMASALPDTRERILNQGQVLRQRGHFWKTVGNFQKALSDYRQVLKLFDKNSRQKILAEAYKDLGDMCRLKNNYRKGMVYLRRAEQIYRALDDKPELAHTLNNIGNLYWIALEYEQALEYLHQALELHRSLDHQAGMASTLNNIAGVHLALSQYQTSIQRYQEALAIQRQLRIPEEVSRVLNNLGVVYMYTADYRQALDSLLESLSINQQTGNLREQVFNLENLGECYQRMGKQTQALQNSRQGLKLAEQIGFTLRKGRILANLGKSSFEQGEFSSAMEQYQQAFEIATQLEDWETQCWVYLYRAELYLRLSQPDLAKSNLHQAEPLLGRLDEARLRIYYCLNRAELFRQENNSASANLEIQAALKLSQEKNLIEEKFAALLISAQLSLDENIVEAVAAALADLERVFEQGEFTRFQCRFILTQALYQLKTDGHTQALELVQTGLERALALKEWETVLELAYLGGQLWQRKNNYEQSYLAYEKGVTLLKRLYQNLAQPELKQSFVQGKIQKKLLAEFKKMAGILAGSKA